MAGPWSAWRCWPIPNPNGVPARIRKSCGVVAYNLNTRCANLDWAHPSGELAAHPNPAAVVIAAHLAAPATGGDMPERHRLKWELTRRLYERGYARQDILELYRLLDWLLVLPDDLAVAFRRELMNYEQEKIMP